MAFRDTAVCQCVTPPLGIAYRRAADERVERNFERVLVPLSCEDSDARLTELLDSFSADFAGLAELTVTATGTTGPAVMDAEVIGAALVLLDFRFTRGCTRVWFRVRDPAT